MKNNGENIIVVMTDRYLHEIVDISLCHHYVAIVITTTKIIIMKVMF